MCSIISKFYRNVVIFFIIINWEKQTHLIHSAEKKNLFDSLSILLHLHILSPCTFCFHVHYSHRSLHFKPIFQMNSETKQQSKKKKLKDKTNQIQNRILASNQHEAKKKATQIFSLWLNVLRRRKKTKRSESNELKRFV